MIVLGTLFAFLPLNALSQSVGIIADYIVTESRPLSDGNRIENTLVGEYAQDTEGRSRLRTNDMYMIADPVDKLAWQVDVVAGVAYKESAEWAEITDTAHQQSAATGDAMAALAWLDGIDENAQPISVNDLGVRRLNGIEARGRSWTYQIPAGTIGNLEPIEMYSEAWTSTEFGYPLPVLVISSDPLNGTNRRELRNFKEQEFDPTFFRPDENRYRIEDWTERLRTLEREAQAIFELQ